MRSSTLFSTLGRLILLLAVVGILAILGVRIFLQSKPRMWERANALKVSERPVLEDAGDLDSFRQALQYSLTYFGRKEGSESVTFGPTKVSVSELRAGYQKLLEYSKSAPSMNAVLDYLTAQGDFFQSAASEVLFTGYYEASLHGSRTRSDRYRYPIYQAPRDLVRIKPREFALLEPLNPPALIRGRLTSDRSVVPYYSREEIDFEDVLAGKGEELLWVDDLVELFFLHIQGSGVVNLEDGSQIRVGYSDSNGQPYRAVARLLIDRGLIPKEQASMQAIRKHLRDHPEITRELLSYNPSYTFFRITPDGPLGALQVRVTPWRSIATDLDLFPRGALAFLRTEEPVVDEAGQVVGWKPIARLVLNQDTGGAIKGPGRVDLFMGPGPENEAKAGAMRRMGQLFFVALR